MNTTLKLNVSSKDSYDAAEAFLESLFKARPIQKVLLINPPDSDASMLRYSDVKRKSYYNYPPYGLGIIARHLLDKGYQVEIHDLNLKVLEACYLSKNEENFDFDATWKAQLAEMVNQFQPDLIGVTCMFTMTHKSFVDVCNEIKNLPAEWLEPNSKIPLAIGGVHVTQSLSRVLDDIPYAEFTFLYEAERAFLNFVEVVKKRLSVHELSQVIIRTPHSRLEFLDEDKPDAEGLNFLPAYELMDMTKYSSYGRIGAFRWVREPDTRLATVLANRGCRAACTFCSVRHFNGVGVRHREVESVVDELEFLRDEYGIGHIMWLDDDLLHDENRAVSLFNEMTRRNLGMTWDASNGVIAYSCKEEVISAAERSGCVGMNIGVESGNPQILREVKKPGTVETFLSASEIIRKHERINSRAFLMLGFPNETYRKLMDTLNLALKMNLDWYNLTILEPLPHTPIFEAMAEQDSGETNSQKPEGRYNSGPHGRQGTIGEERNVIPHEEFWDMFLGSSLDTIPSKEKLLDIWFYSNYYLNFYSLFQAGPESKLKRQARYVKNICLALAPNNPFAIYFHTYLQQQLYGVYEEQLIKKLEEKLDSSLFWKNAFVELELSIDQLEKRLPIIKPKIDLWLDFKCVLGF
tara:strand:- start:1150 stop:3054 length:1905 start_codon:yes stop_codon:yes gene_type:complete